MSPPFNTQAVGIAGAAAATAGVIAIGSEMASPAYLVKLWSATAAHQPDPMTIAQLVAPLFAICFGIIASYLGRPANIPDDPKPKS